MPRPAIFFDRDGVLVKDCGYDSNPANMTLLEGAQQTLATIKKSGFAVIVISNQSGVARGKFSINDVIKYNDELQVRLTPSHQTPLIDAFYFCPHHPSGTVDQYAIDCHCRKPRTGMIENATRELNINLDRSWLVGDKSSDIDCGIAIRVKTIQMPPPHDSHWHPNTNFRISNLSEIIPIIESQIHRRV